MRSLFIAILLTARLCGARTASNLWAKLEPVAPFPATKATAEINHIPVEGIDAAPQGKTLAPGDSVTGLITLHQKDQPRAQWLVYLQVEDDRKAPPAKKAAPIVVYSSIGNKLEFASSSTAISARTLGPFSEPETKQKAPTTRDKIAQLSVSPDFLGLGLDQGVALVYRWRKDENEKKSTNAHPLVFQFGQPFSAAKISHDQKEMLRNPVTPDEERALAGWGPALYSYMTTVQQTPDLNDIMLKVIKMPSAWSILKNVGVNLDFGMHYEKLGPLSLTGWDLPVQPPVYSMPWIIYLNGDNALDLTLVVTAPRPPFLACGGIIGMLVENPADPENYLTMRIISAHCGSGAGEVKK